MGDIVIVLVLIIENQTINLYYAIKTGEKSTYNCIYNEID